MRRNDLRKEPRFRVIASELRARIVAGTLRPGDAIPSTREIMRESKVAMATATRVLNVLRDDGLVRVVPGVGTVVAGRAPRDATRRATNDGARGTTFRTRMVHAACVIADHEGLDAVSFRRLAADLETPTMSLYRHVASKEILLELMVDSAFGRHPIPAPAQAEWRAQLETIARIQWRFYRQHPWLAQALSLSFTRPMLAPRAMAYTEWTLASIASLGLSPTVMFQTAVTLAGYVHGTALKLLSETDAQHETGVTDDEWMKSQEGVFATTIGDGAFPMLAKLTVVPDVDINLESLFEFGLQRLLDGFSAYFRRIRRDRGLRR